MRQVVVLGAKGRFGRAAVEAFATAGWEVTAVARNRDGTLRRADVNYTTGDALNLNSLRLACRGQRLIINAINPPYHHWQRDLPGLTANIITVAAENEATVMIPGNVYNYGKELPAVLTEETPHVPNTRKGRLRIEMEQAYREAASKGVRTILLRGGDFIEGKATGNWFEDHITNKVAKGIVTYPGPLDAVHAWAYLPDMARALVGLAERSDEFSTFEEFGFEGYSLTGHDLVAAIEAVIGRKLAVKRFPWSLLKVMSLFSPLVREVQEMRYLWERPHRIDGNKLRRTLPGFEPSPLAGALVDALSVKNGTLPAAQHSARINRVLIDGNSVQ